MGDWIKSVFVDFFSHGFHQESGFPGSESLFLDEKRLQIGEGKIWIFSKLFNNGCRGLFKIHCAGLIAFLMTRKDYNDEDPFPGVLPFISLSKSWYALNVTYIPKVSPKHKALFYFQVMLRVAEF